ncbi:hypothetical protein TRFO_17032 [Tritrichomonas foetus]|uniref:Mid2 domain-containing protein n=1 Tax=Tritrichomonas foetus TaxID=1144522 RepID=A0A1J4KSY1_9EUKA|nr:hypothetical protein TRFO_17032 [Tritrichomonas foetus]|eukprot:OHT12892.1 hypothetical protein TRFO_17032 [Tritrichomonas foetus]
MMTTTIAPTFEISDDQPIQTSENLEKGETTSVSIPQIIPTIGSDIPIKTTEFDYQHIQTSNYENTIISTTEIQDIVDITSNMHEQMEITSQIEDQFIQTSERKTSDIKDPIIETSEDKEIILETSEINDPIIQTKTITDQNIKESEIIPSLVPITQPKTEIVITSNNNAEYSYSSEEIPCSVSENDFDDTGLKGKDKKIGTGAIVGITIGIIVLIALIIVLVLFFIMKKRKQEEDEEDEEGLEMETDTNILSINTNFSSLFENSSFISQENILMTANANSSSCEDPFANGFEEYDV